MAGAEWVKQQRKWRLNEEASVETGDSTTFELFVREWAPIHETESEQKKWDANFYRTQYQLQLHIHNGRLITWRQEPACMLYKYVKSRCNVLNVWTSALQCLQFRLALCGRRKLLGSGVKNVGVEQTFHTSGRIEKENVYRKLTQLLYVIGYEKRGNLEQKFIFELCIV